MNITCYFPLKLFFLCQFQRPRWRESISPEKTIWSWFGPQNTPGLQANWRHVTKTPSFGAWNRAWRRMELWSVIFTFSFFFFFDKCPFKHATVKLQPALGLSRPAPGILDTFLCRVNVFLFSIVLSFYWVLIVSGRLDWKTLLSPNGLLKNSTSNWVKFLGDLVFSRLLRFPKQC